MFTIAHFPRYAAAALLLGLAACDLALPELPLPPGPAPTACGAPALQGLVGQDAAVLHAMTFAVQVRIIRPGDMVTEDYSEQRLNIGVDANEKISRVYCG